MNESEFHLISPKKLIIFGSCKSGKSTFTEFLTGNKFEENENLIKEKENGKKILIINSKILVL